MSRVELKRVSSQAILTCGKSIKSKLNGHILVGNRQICVRCAPTLSVMREMFSEHLTYMAAGTSSVCICCSR